MCVTAPSIAPSSGRRVRTRPYPVTRYRFGNTNPVLIKRFLCACPTRGVLRRNATRGAVTIITSRVVRSRFSSPQRGDKQYARARVGQLYCMLFRFDSAEQTRRLVWWEQIVRREPFSYGNLYAIKYYCYYCDTFRILCAVLVFLLVIRTSFSSTTLHRPLVWSAERKEIETYREKKSGQNRNTFKRPF